MSGGDYRDIGGWIKHSFIDFPGTVSTVLFFRGCNLRCPYCHNPDLLNATGSSVDTEEIFTYLRKRSGIIEGVVLSGGEPTLHGDTLVSLVERLRRLDLSIKLDTNGLLPEMITAVAPEYCALDLKTTPARYPELGDRTRTDRHPLYRSLDIIKAMGENAEVRITVAAPFIDDAVIGEFIALLEGVSTVYLQPFRSTTALLDPDFAAGGNVPAETIRRYRDQLMKIVPNCSIRGDL